MRNGSAEEGTSSLFEQIQSCGLWINYKQNILMREKSTYSTGTFFPSRPLLSFSQDLQSTALTAQRETLREMAGGRELGCRDFNSLVYYIMASKISLQ